MQHGRILTNLERHQRGLTNNPFNHFCPRETEDLSHLFRFCTKTKELWGHLLEKRLLIETHELSSQIGLSGTLREGTQLMGKGTGRKIFNICLVDLALEK